MGERESKMGESEKQKKVDLSSIKEKQNRKEKKQILSTPIAYLPNWCRGCSAAWM